MKSDSKAGCIKAVRAAVKAGTSALPAPLMELAADELAHYRQLADEMDPAKLTPQNLNLLALLAQAMGRIARETITLHAEGMVIVDPHGRKMPNPRRATIQHDIVAVEKLRRLLA